MTTVFMFLVHIYLPIILALDYLFAAVSPSRRSFPFASLLIVIGDLSPLNLSVTQAPVALAVCIRCQSVP